MRRARAYFAAGAVGILAAAGGCAGTGLGRGASGAPAQAPDFNLPAAEGGSVRGSSLWARRPVLVVFMMTTCETCRSEVERLNDLIRRHSVVAIATGDTAEEVSAFRRETGARYPILLDDGRTADAWKVTGTPTCILVDAGGAVRSRGKHPPEAME